MLRAHFPPLGVVAPAALVIGLVMAGTGEGAPIGPLSAGCGQSMTLGAMNTCDGSTALTGSLNGNLFNVTNTNTGGSATAIRGSSNSAAAALRAVNTGVGVGLQGSGIDGSGVTGTSTNGIGVMGAHSATTGAGPGVRGETASTAADAAGVFGRLTATAPGIGSAAVRGQNSGTNANGSGVFGSHAGSGSGVRGKSQSGIGVLGSHDALTGTAPGLQGETRSTDGSAAGVLGTVVATNPGGFSAGVRGINSGAGGLGIGVWGSHAGGGWGVFGEAKSGIGVHGESTSGNGVAADSHGSAPALTATNTADGPAAEFTAAGAPFTVSSSTKVDDLNADQLDGRSAEELGGRTAVAAIISYTHDGGTFAEQAKIVIDAPKDGLMLVSGAVSMSTLLGGDTSCDPCLGVMQLRDAVNGTTGAQQVGTLGNGSAEASAQLATTWVFPVTAGRRTFALDTLTEGATGDVFSDNPTLTALFVPFGPSGQATASAVATRTAQRRRGE